uniref:Major facilitator superfamily (MFS) profile domain-containing protein n=1 Tax=Brassica oleracea var. oleracea TaxID=109376 RepID=A0A0D3CAR4_BRAOL
MSGPSEPLLLSHIGADDSNVDHKTRPEALTFDSIVEHSLSDFGFWQLFQVILVGVALFFDAQQIFITVYTDAYPTWHCLNHTICDHSTSDICRLPRSAWEWDGGSKDKTVISDFGLECSSSLLRGMPTSAFYIGGIVGGFVLALIPDDSLGRKKLVLFSTFAMSITSISVIFSTNVWIYTTLKFIIGFSRSQTWSYALVLISERVSTRWRPRATMIPFTFFVLGFMSLSGIAYLAQHSSWRFLYLYTVVPAIFYCIFLCIFALESPRWLHMQGNDEEAINVLKSMSSKNKPYLESLVSVLPLEQETSEELPRRSSVLVNTLLGGASGVLCFVLSVLGKTGIAFAFELSTFFCARIGFNLMAVYMVEMFPTCVRSSATMMFRQALVVGGACCPLIASIGRDLPSVSFAIFGVAMSGLGLFVLILPETKGSSLCDTMEEQEKRDQAINSSRC